MEEVIRENDVISMLKKAFPNSGIGDDTAVVRPGDGDLLLASDAVVEGVHFRLETSTPGQAVQKAVTSNVSDIFAMGGKPERILLTAGLPGGVTEADAEEIVKGVSIACARYGIDLSGGDTVLSPGGYFFDVAITGTVPRGRAVMRKGAEEGDLIVVSGSLGGSLGGLRILECLLAGGEIKSRRQPAVEAFGKRFVEITGEIAESILSASGKLSLSTTDDSFNSIMHESGIEGEYAPALRLIARHIVPVASDFFASDLENIPAREDITSMIDISDGLARDLFTLCGESGTGAVIDMDRIPASPELELIFGAGSDLIDELLLTSGEEYRLLFTMRSGSTDSLPDGAALIGRIVSASEGIRLVDREGNMGDIPVSGYEHSF
jgi:thiamine-monophosphate kinase